MRCVPEPPEDAIPVNEPETAEIGPGQRATFEYVPQQRETPGFVIPMVAASKFNGMSYRVRFDDQERYGPASVPPTDIDAPSVTFLPAYEFQSKLTVIITNISDTATRTVTVQPIGYEKPRGGS